MSVGGVGPRTKEEAAIFARERILFAAGEVLSVAMEDKKVTDRQLAKMLHRKTSTIIGWLQGDPRMKLVDLSDALSVLGFEVNLLEETFGVND